MRGHGPGQETLQVGKREVAITEVEAVGHYAIRPTFSDGHDTGIYSWDYLYDLGVRQDELWQRYLARSRGRREPRPGRERRRAFGARLRSSPLSLRLRANARA